MFCGQCGKEWIEGAAFCPLCGSPICLAEMKKPTVTQQTRLMKTIAVIFLLCSMGLFFGIPCQSRIDDGMVPCQSTEGFFRIQHRCSSDPCFVSILHRDGIP